MNFGVQPTLEEAWKTLWTIGWILGAVLSLIGFLWMMSRWGWLHLWIPISGYVGRIDVGLSRLDSISKVIDILAPPGRPTIADRLESLESKVIGIRREVGQIKGLVIADHEASASGMMHFEADFSATFANTAALSIFRQPLNVCLKHGWLSSIYNGYREKVERELNSAAKDVRPVSVHFGVQYHESQGVHVVAHFRPLVSDVGSEVKLTGWHAVIAVHKPEQGTMQ